MAAIAKMAARLMVGKKMKELGLEGELPVHHYFVKSPVFPFNKLPGADTILGPEMKSTGEVMGTADDFGLAFAKAQTAAGQRLPTQGSVFLSVNDDDKPNLLPLAHKLTELGFDLIATRGSAKALRDAGVEAKSVFKVNEGRPNIVDLIKNGNVDLIINTPLGSESRFDEKAIRRAAVEYQVSCITTLSGAAAAVSGIAALQSREPQVASLQELHRKARMSRASSNVTTNSP